MDNHASHLNTVPIDNDEDSLVDLIFKACKYNCLDLLEFECFKKFGHDSLSRLTPAQENYIVLRCRARVARRAKNMGYRPLDMEDG